jgi:aspartyl-tRNA synthetase
MRENKYRNHMCGELTEKNINETVTLSGFVASIRDHGGVLFLDLRDSSGITQIVTNDNSIFDNITRESVVKVKGTVRLRSIETINEKLNTGKIEVLVNDLEILSLAKNVLPFEILTSTETSEETRIKYRYLDLRNKKMHDNIVFRSNVIKFLRKEMESMDFLEVQTPILTASSPEGARDFIVPSRKFPGKFYALPQAPQIFKQLLMVSGFNRYFQVAPCFRDEDARVDRVYGEFYQLDMEMSFAEPEDVYEVTEKIFYDTFKEFSKKEITKPPFRRIAYKEAMLKYGTDKPDLRNPLEITDITEILKDTSFKPFINACIRAIKVDEIGTNSNSWFNDIVAFASSIGMPGIGYVTLSENAFKGPIDKFLTEKEREELINKLNLKENSVIFFIANKEENIASKYAGEIRNYLGEKLELIDKNKYEFCIINDFPMYEYDEESEKYIFTHNPFSMMQGGMDSLLNKKPEEILAYQWDFVCNGIELVSGAVRNHDINIMEKAFAIAGYPKEELEMRFKSLYTAFQYGAPPHAGMAIGIDRMLMMLKDEKSIREMIAFPLLSSGADALTGATTEVTNKQLKEVHIKL